MLSTDSPYHLQSIAKSHKENKHARTEQLTPSLSDSQNNASLDSRGRARIEQFPLQIYMTTIS
jgi:hypothetical protein